MSAFDPNELGPRLRGPGAWSRLPQRFVAVELPSPSAFQGVRRYQSVTCEQWRELEDLGRRIQGASLQVVGVASIVAFAHGGADDLACIPPIELTLIQNYVAAETSAGRQLPGWLTNGDINRARIG